MVEDGLSQTFNRIITKKMADVHFIRMHCGRKSLKKANGRLLKDRQKRQEVNFFVVLKFLSLTNGRVSRVKSRGSRVKSRGSKKVCKNHVII